MIDKQEFIYLNVIQIIFEIIYC